MFWDNIVYRNINGNLNMDAWTTDFFVISW